MKIVRRRFLWLVALFILSWRKSQDEWLTNFLFPFWYLFHILISDFYFQDIIHQCPQGLFWEKTAYKSKLTCYWGEIWEDPKHDSWWMYIILFLFSWYGPYQFILLLILCCTCFTFAAIASELRGRWQDNRRSSSAKEDINVVRWEQCKQLLQSGKHKV